MFENPYQRKIKKSFLLEISCDACKEKIAVYQKLGRGNVLRMYLPRITKSAINLSDIPRKISCPNCQQHIADRIQLKEKKEVAYRMIRSTYNTQEIH